MNRKLLALLTPAFAFYSTTSCSDKSNGDITGVGLGGSTPDAPAAAAAQARPGAIADLTASEIGSTSVTLSFTQVDDGTGQPAKYDVRYAVAPISWGSAKSTTSGTCSTPVAGTAAGSQLSCTVLGLTPATNYNFQLIAFRGTLNVAAVFGSTSNVVAAATTSSTPPPPPPPSPPPVPVASVSVTPASATLAIGATVQLQVSAFDANNNPLTGRIVTSSSADPGIASINSAGLVTAVAAGTTQITVASEGKSAIATITVSAAAPPPAVKPSTVTDLRASGTASTSVTLSFTQVSDGAGQPAKYDVRYAVAPISWGSAKSTTSGTCSTPVADTATGSQLSCTVLGLTPATNYNFQLIAFRGTLNVDAVFGSISNVVAAATTSSTPPPPPPPSPPPVPVASVSVTPASATLAIGATVQLQVTARDANNNVLTGRVVTSSSADAAIASVNSLGLVTAVSAGTTQITVTSEGKSAVATITVSPTAPTPVATVAVSPASSSLLVGATAQLTATTRDANNNVLTGRAVTWSSASAAIASVTTTGLVRGVSAGSTQVTATSEGKTASATITVTAPPPAPVATVTVSPGATNLQVGATAQLSAATRDANNTLLTGRTISWSSSNSSVATVTPLGVVKAMASGTIQITATSEGKTGNAAVTGVDAPPPPPPGSSPEPVAGDQILLQDDFNRATVALQLGPYASAGTFSRVAGHGGDGLRVSYNSSTWNTNTIARDLSSVSTDAYYRYWYRLSSGADVTCGGRNWSGFKWFMTHRSDPNPRYTHGVSMLSGGPAGKENVGMEFTTHDNSSTRQPNPFVQNINKTKRFNTTNDGQWHEYTLHVVTGNSGYEQIWIDGVKVLDSQGFGYDHAALGISSIALPGTMVQWYSGCDWTIDIDDLVVWHH